MYCTIQYNTDAQETPSIEQALRVNEEEYLCNGWGNIWT